MMRSFATRSPATQSPTPSASFASTVAHSCQKETALYSKMRLSLSVASSALVLLSTLLCARAEGDLKIEVLSKPEQCDITSRKGDLLRWEKLQPHIE